MFRQKYTELCVVKDLGARVAFQSIASCVSYVLFINILIEEVDWLLTSPEDQVFMARWFQAEIATSTAER